MKFFLSFLILLVFACAKAQDIKTLQDSTVSLEKTYMGFSMGNLFSYDSLHAKSNASIRFGAKINYKIQDGINLESFVVFQGGAQKSNTIWNLGIRGQISKEYFLKFGKIPTPATLLRPHPVSQNGHFESWTTSQLPAAAPGFMLGSSKIKLGLHVRNSEFEYHLQHVLSQKTQVSIWYSESELGFARKYSDKKITSVLFFKKTETNEYLGYLFSYKIPKHKLNLYLDSGYSFSKRDASRLEIGVLRTISKPLFKGFVGGGWNYEKKGIMAYLVMNM